MKILGIETSCDETAVALIDASGEFGPDFSVHTLGNALISQIKEHQRFGGVMPNLAKREHGRNLVPVMMEALLQASMLEEVNREPDENLTNPLKQLLERESELYGFLMQFLRVYTQPQIDCIAVTVGPGLEPALWVGINFARALSLTWNTPIVAVNHMEGHIIMGLMEGEALAKFDFPILSLLVSGGHTELVLSRDWMHYEILGATRDDAAGEAFDKVARMLGLLYPGGPHVARLASGARHVGFTKSNISLPRPMLNEKNYDFSFAGLKTAVLRIVEKHQPLSDSIRGEIAREFEDSVTEVLLTKTMRAAEEYGVQSLIVSGGVSANTHVREKFRDACQKASVSVFFPPPEFSTDNALMIALAGYFHAHKNEYADSSSLKANGALKLTEKT